MRMPMRSGVAPLELLNGRSAGLIGQLPRGAPAPSAAATGPGAATVPNPARAPAKPWGKKPGGVA